MIAPEGLEAGSDAVPRGEQADFEMRSGLQEPDDLLGVGRGDVGIEGEQAFDPLGAGGWMPASASDSNRQSRSIGPRGLDLSIRFVTSL